MKLKEMLQSTGINGRIKVERKRVPIDKLDSMLDYQRDIDMAFVEEKSRDDVFDENEVSIVLISVRQDGSMKVCDGQHTIAILKKRGYTMVECELRYGLTIQEENDWFNVENTKRRNQSRKRTLTAQINGTYEKNKEEQDFYNCIKSVGFKLDIYGEESGSDFKIGCPANLLNNVDLPTLGLPTLATICFATIFPPDKLYLLYQLNLHLYDHIQVLLHLALFQYLLI